MTQSGRVVDTAIASFTTDEEPYTGPTPSLTLDFGGLTTTNFRMTYTGLTSINVRIVLGASTDVSHARVGIDPTQTYTHTATRRTLPGLGVPWIDLNGLYVSAIGPGGTITISYPDPGTGPSLSAAIAARNFYRDRGWTTNLGVSGVIDCDRSFGPGSYT